ncbi:CdaR family protein [Winogradskyella sp.]
MNSKKRTSIFSHFKRRDVKRFSIFMTIAFVFLIFSKLTNDYRQSIKLKIDVNDLAEEFVIKNDSLNSIDVLVEAKGIVLVPFIFKDYETINIDANSDITIGTDAIVFDVQKNKFLIANQLGSSYKILTIKPDTLAIPYSKRASKYVPLLLNETINYAPGFDIKGNFTFSIDSIKIVGAEERIQEINALETQKLNLNNVNTNIDETLELVDVEGVDMFPSSVKVKAEVKRFTEGKIEVPVTLINKPEDVVINYFPKTVSLSYYVDLESFNLVTASDFLVECDFSQIDEKQTYLEPKISKKPDFIKRVSLKQKRIDFIKL